MRGVSISVDLPPQPPRGPGKPSLHDLQYREQEIRTKLLEAQLREATDPNANMLGIEDRYVWDSKNLEWVEQSDSEEG